MAGLDAVFRELSDIRYQAFVAKVGKAAADRFCDLPMVSHDLADLVAKSGTAPAVTKYLCENPQIAGAMSLMAHDDLVYAFAALVAHCRDKQ